MEWPGRSVHRRDRWIATSPIRVDVRQQPKLHQMVAGGPQLGGRTAEFLRTVVLRSVVAANQYSTTKPVTTSAGAACVLPTLSDTTLQIEQSCVSWVVVWTCVSAVVTSETNDSAVISAISASQALARSWRPKMVVVGWRFVDMGRLIRNISFN